MQTFIGTKIRQIEKQSNGFLMLKTSKWWATIVLYKQKIKKASETIFGLTNFI